MTDKRQATEWQHRRELQHAGVKVSQTDVVGFNYGSETFAHAFAKLAAAWVLREKGYRVDSEVEVPEGEIDVLGYASEDKDCVAVECETSPTKDVIKDKIKRYTHGLPIRECFVINVNEVPNDKLQAVDYVRCQL